jgi:hypothetical protein
VLLDESQLGHREASRKLSHSPHRSRDRGARHAQAAPKSRPPWSRQLRVCPAVAIPELIVQSRLVEPARWSRSRRRLAALKRFTSCSSASVFSWSRVVFDFFTSVLRSLSSTGPTRSLFISATIFGSDRHSQHTRRVKGAGQFQSCSVRKVSQFEVFPDFKPFVNQRVRCAEEPWVKASGTT